MITYQNILYCTDFSEDAEIALHHAVDLAKRHGAKLHVLHCPHSTLRYMPSETDEGAPPGDVTYTSPELLTKLTEELKQRYGDRLKGLDVEWVVLVGTPFVEILRYVREHGIDLVVMGTEGASGGEDTHYGSTVEQVAKRCPCHVMAIRNPERVYTL
ncbi:MAG: universal stress protein [Desulfarculaceae bacterium]|nr:universal stress protein [Desulfarculaceae bacterium]MCF8073020.1 universal stress protein [Desulfarculaceae bacterium]MCF8101895.1 universal stress protein [Desulfarculaceae bacterium]MCF8115422.1 universal stress protein [Desulfarculaceae bacterium]